MSAKKFEGIRMEPEVKKRLKFLAVQQDKPIGDVIEGLLDFAEADQFITDETFRKRFRSLFDTVMINAGESGMFEPTPEKVAKEKEDKRRELLEELRKLEGDE